MNDRTNRTRLLERNITAIKWFQAFDEPLFWGPILILSLQKLAKMPIQEIYFMESVTFIVPVSLNALLGAFADKFGRRKTMVIGQVFNFVSFAGFAFMDSPAMAWITNMIWAIGYSFKSGADTSLLHDTLIELGRESERFKITGKINAICLLVSAPCALVAGYLADINLRLPLYISMIPLVIPFVSSRFIIEPLHLKRAEARKESQLRLLKKGALLVWRSKEVRWIVGFSTLITVASKAWFFAYNPYFETVGVSLPQYGVVFFFLNLFSWFSSHFATEIRQKIGERGCVACMVALLGFPVLVMGLVPWWPLVYLVLLQCLVRGFLSPFAGEFLDRHVEASEIRTTVSSVSSTFINLGEVVFLWMFGLSMGMCGILSSFIFLGLTILIVGALQYRTYGKLKVRKLDHRHGQAQSVDGGCGVLECELQGQGQPLD